MIGESIEFVRKQLRDHLGVADDEVIVNAARKLMEENNAAGAYISLINVQQETTMRNTPHVVRNGAQSRYKEPPVFVNLHLLFAFEFQTYSTSLQRLSETIELFQHRRFFDTQNTGFPPGMEKITFEMVNLDFGELNNLWGVLGGSYFPSVVYKMRMLRLQTDTDAAAPVVTGVEMNWEVS